MKHKTSKVAKEKVRTAVILRLEPSLAIWLADVSNRTGIPRNTVIERWLSALRETITGVEDESNGVDPFGAVDCAGRALVRNLIDLGVAGGLLKAGWEEYLEEQQRLVEMVEEDKREREEEKRRRK